MKKIIPLLLTIILLMVPLNSVFAYNGGLLQNISDNYGRKGSTDNNLSTYEYLGGKMSGFPGVIGFTLPNPSDLNSFYFNGSSNKYLQVSFYDGSNTVLYTSPRLENGETTINFPTPLKGVVSASISQAISFGDYGKIPIYEFDVYGSQTGVVQHTELKNLSLIGMDKEVSLSWEIPIGNSDYNGTKVYRDGNLLAHLGNTATTYKDVSREYGKNYQYKITATYSDGYETSGISQSIVLIEPDRDSDGIPDSLDQYPDDPTNTPPKPPGEIKDLQVEKEYNRVDLSWVLPGSTNFNKVRIYRDTLQQTSFLDNVFLGSKAYAAETPIFETNGTYFNDLTVTPETTYEYTLSTVSDKGLESEGITTQVTTPPEPSPVLSGEEFSEQENGDYIATWEQPTEGTVKIIVDGKVIAEVPASQGSYTIPKDQVIENKLGEPIISLQPISTNGKAGEVVSTKEIPAEIPFTINELIKSGLEILLYVSPFVLLALSFLIVPKFRRMILNSFGQGEKSLDKETRQEKKRESTKKEDSKEVAKGSEVTPKRSEVAPRVRESRKIEIAPRIREARQRDIKAPKEKREARQPREAKERTRREREPRSRRGS